MSAWVLLAGCLAHPSEREARRGAPLGVEAPQRVVYRLWWDDREVGTETIDVDHEPPWRRWRGRLEQTEPVESDLEWTVLEDPARAEPVGFEVVFRLAGEAVKLQAWRDGDILRVERRAFGRTETSALAHGPGTVVELGSPLSGWWAWRLLADEMALDETADVRAVVVRAPRLAPTVELVRFRRGEEGLVLHGPGDERTELLLGPGRFPRRVTTTRPAWPRALRRIRE